MEKRIYCNITKCLGCKSCEIACAVEHSEKKDLFSAIKERPLPHQRIVVQCDTHFQSYPLQCRHCDEPLCALACISGAMHKDEETGLVTSDETKCIGCGMCIMVCPFGALIMDKEKKVTLKCDHCMASGEPVCVKACPTGALFFGELEEFKAQCDT